MHRLTPYLPPPPPRRPTADPDHLAILLIILIDTRHLTPGRPHPNAPSPN